MRRNFFIFELKKKKQDKAVGEIFVLWTRPGPIKPCNLNSPNVILKQKATADRDRAAGVVALETTESRIQRDAVAAAAPARTATITDAKGNTTMLRAAATARRDVRRTANGQITTHSHLRRLFWNPQSQSRTKPSGPRLHYLLNLYSGIWTIEARFTSLVKIYSVFSSSNSCWI